MTARPVVLWRSPDTLTLWGIPYDMRPGQSPADLFAAQPFPRPGWYGAAGRAAGPREGWRIISAQLARDLGRPAVDALARTFEPEQVVGGPGGNDPEPAASPRPVMDWAAVQTTMAEASALALAAVAEGRGEFAAFAARKAAHWAFVLSLRIDQQETERRAA